MDITQITQNSQSAQSSQSAKLNKCAAQRRYRKKEGQGFLQLRQALKEVSKDPRSKQDTLKRASCELRRLADENKLLLQAVIEAWNNTGEFDKDDHLRPTSDEDPLLGMEWWSHDTTMMADITRSDMARHRVLAASVLPTMNMFTSPECEGLFQMQSATVTYGHANLWAQHESGNIARRPHETVYSAGCCPMYYRGSMSQ